MTTTRHQEEQEAAAAPGGAPPAKKARAAEESSAPSAAAAATGAPTRAQQPAAGETKPEVKQESGAAETPGKPAAGEAAPSKPAAGEAAPSKPGKPAPQPPAPSAKAARARTARKLAGSRVVEEGTIAFLAKPRKGLPALTGAGDAQRLYIALLPADASARARLLIVGRKTLPADAAGTHGGGASRAWGFVDAVSDVHAVPALFGGADAIDAAEAGGQGRPRVLAEGHYVLCAHGARDAVLAYDVDEPAVAGDADAPAAAAFGVHPGGGAFHVSVKNPDHAAPGLGLSGKSRATRADFGDAAAAFGGGGAGGGAGPPGGYAWAPATGAGGGRLLETRHAEVLLVGTSLGSSSLSEEALQRLRDAHHTAVGGEAADEAWVREALGDVGSGVLEVGAAVTGAFEEKE